MAKDKLTDYDSTAANNLDVGGISVAEGMLPSGVNNAIREQMSHLADFAAGTEAITKLATASIDANGGTIKLDGNYPTGTGNVALGDAALDDGSLSGDYNTALGSSALTSNTSGGLNVAIGTSSGFANTTGSSNTSVGFQSLASNTTASYNTAAGYQAGYANTTGISLTAMGYKAGNANTTGNNNTAVGSDSFKLNTTGASNTALGASALLNNTTANSNTAVGYQAGYSNTTGINNVAIGYGALYSSTVTDNNLAIGRDALRNSTGGQNLAIGTDAGLNVTTGYANTFVGRGDGTAAGYLVTTGSKNTILGGYSGNQDNLDIRTSSNNIVLSDGDGRPRIHIDTNSDIHRYYPSINQTRTDFDATYFGYSGGYTVLKLGQTSGNHTVSIGYNPSGNTSGGFTGNGSETLFRRSMKFLTPNSADTTFYVQFTMTDGVTSGDFNDTSDVALKENIQPISSAWDTVNQLRPVTFDWKQEGRGTRSGFIAQEVEVLLPNDVLGDDYIAPDVENGIEGNSGKAINTTGIVAHLTKALQEAMNRIETLEAKVAALEAN